MTGIDLERMPPNVFITDVCHLRWFIMFKSEMSLETTTPTTK